MKKKIIIGAIAVILIAILVFGIFFSISFYKNKVIQDYKLVVSRYFNTTRQGNNKLMSIADTYSVYSGAFTYERATEDLNKELLDYKELAKEIDKAYKEIEETKIKYEETKLIKDVTDEHYKEYKVFENNVLNKTQENYEENYGRVYKDWQIPFSKIHKELKKTLG